MTDNPTPAFHADRLSLLWAVKEHAPLIAALHAQMFPEAWDAQAIDTLLAHPGSIAMVATVGGGTNVGGFVLAQVAADEAEILTIGVTPDWRRHGVGRRLVDGVKRAASRSGARSLFLEVAESNASARKLYESCDFAEAGRRKGYYVRAGAAPEDAIVMRLAMAD